jgi:hypothetical protein
MNTPNQNADSFEALAHAAMDFLVTEFGFQCTTSNQHLVRYESSAVFCEVGHGDYDAEVYARVGRLGALGVLPDQPSERLDFGLFLAVADPTGYQCFHQEVPYACAREPVNIARVLARFADGFRIFGRGLLEADPEIYQRARELRFWHAPSLPTEQPQHSPAQQTSDRHEQADKQTGFGFQTES